MSEKERMLRRLGALDFAIWELHIFLDTHPNNLRALKTYNDYVDKRTILVEEYEGKFGPLHLGREESDKWTWINSPWPWEYRKEER